jgi:hypothetical protein
MFRRSVLLVFYPPVARTPIVTASLPYRQDTLQDPSVTDATVRPAAAIRRLRIDT